LKNYLLIFSLLFICQLRAQNINIPDSVFKNALINSYCVDTNLDGFGDMDADINDDGEIQVSEAEAVISLRVNNRGINDLTGIEAFVNLEYLDCSQNSLGTIDISQNTKLKELNCKFSHLDNLDLLTNVNLEILVCKVNDLLTLNIDTLPNLEILNFSNNYVSNIDTSNNPLLEVLYADENDLTSLDISQNNNLKYLSLQGNQITSLDFINNPFLEILNLIGNQLININLSDNTYPNLSSLSCGFNQLTELDVSACTSLEYLSCYYNSNLESLNVKNGYFTGSTNYGFSGCPNLVFVCSDTEKIDYIQDLVDSYGYTGCTVSSNCTLSVNEVNDSLYVTLFPNPVTETISIKSDKLIDSISIYDINGRLVISSVFGKNDLNYTMNTNELSSGAYFIITKSGKFEQKSKFIKL
jgi:hypothetical protein